MLGRIGSPGLFSYAFEELYKEILNQRKQKDFVVKMSFMEIYNEIIKDLIGNSEEESTNLEI